MSSDSEDSNKTRHLDFDQVQESSPAPDLSSSPDAAWEPDSPSRYVPLPGSNPQSRVHSPLSPTPDETDTHPLCAYMMEHGSALVVDLGKRKRCFKTTYNSWLNSTANKWYHEMITGAIQPPVFDKHGTPEEEFNFRLTELFREWRSANPDHELPKYNVDDYAF